MKKATIAILEIFLLINTVTTTYANSIYINEEENYEITIPTTTDTQTEPNINARHAVVIERNTKKILYGKKENEQCKMASTTKIMTATIVLENCKLGETAIISSKAANTGGSRLGLKKDDKITVLDLLYGLLLCSGNDAAVALAEKVSGSVENFAILMNKKAEELGLTNSNFVTPHGLDNEGHYTTAFELAIITDYALKNKTFYNIVATKNYTVTINGIPKSIHNTNELLGNLNGVYGVKTGFTNGANRCLVTAAKRDDLDIICVVLGCDAKKNRTSDSINLIEYTFNNFKMINIKNQIEKYFEEWKKTYILQVNINKGKNKNLEIELEKIPYEFYPVNKKYEDAISILAENQLFFEAPIQPNSNIANLLVYYNDELIIKLKIYNNNLIEKKTFIDYYTEILKNYFSYFSIR